MKLRDSNIEVSLVVKERDRRRLTKIEDSEQFKNIKIYRNMDLAVNKIQKDTMKENL